MKMKVLLAVALTLSMASANAMLIRVSQESAAGAGDFDANVLGFISVYGHDGTSPAIRRRRCWPTIPASRWS